jgi:hypothetical protein
VENHEIMMAVPRSHVGPAAPARQQPHRAYQKHQAGGTDQRLTCAHPVTMQDDRV